MRRRTFLSSVSALAWSRALLSGTALTWASSGRADPTTYALISASISAINAISALNHGDGGLGETLTTLQDTLNLAVRQLVSIQRTLGELMLKVDELPSEMAALLSEQYALELSDDLQAKIARVLDIQEAADLEGVDLNAAAADRGDYPDKLRTAWIAFNDSRRLFQTASVGAGPRAAAISNHCLAVDGLMYGYGILRPVDVRIACDKQLAWLEGMLNPENLHSVVALHKASQDKEARLWAETAARGRQSHGVEVHRLTPPEIEVLERNIAADIAGQFGQEMAAEFGTALVGFIQNSIANLIPLPTGWTTVAFVTHHPRVDEEKDGATLVRLGGMTGIDLGILHVDAVSLYSPTLDDPAIQAVRERHCVFEAAGDIHLSEQEGVDIRWNVRSNRPNVAHQIVRDHLVAHAREKSHALRYLDSDVLAANVATQLDPMNMERLMQVYLGLTLGLVDENREIAANMRADFAALE